MNRYLPQIWLLIVGLLIAIFVLLLSSTRINSNLFDLLPSNKKEQYSHELVDNFTSTIDQQLIWLVSSDKDVEAIAQYWVDALHSVSGIQSIVGQKSPETLEKWTKDTLNFSTLIPQKVIEKMQQGVYPSWVISQIYSPFSGVSVAELNHDPLLLVRATILEQLANNGQFSMNNGWVMVNDAQNRSWVLLRATIDPSYQGMLDKKALVESLSSYEQALIEFDPTATLLKKGSVYYADFAIKTAEKDITTIGITSMLGVILIFFWMFRSLRAIGVIILALMIGLLSGTVVVLLIYGEIHIITIVMSTSIIGVAIDYALLFLTARMLEGHQYSPMETLQQIKKPLAGALISTILAYCVLLFAPFAGLTQLAIFTMSGLIAVFLTIICWFPIIAIIKERKLERTLKLADQILYVLEHSRIYRKFLPILMVIVSIVGVIQLSHNDDVGHLQSLPPELVVDDHKMNEILKQSSSTQVLMVTGKTSEKVLENLEHLYPLLDRWVEDKIIESYQAFPFLSSNQQNTNIQLLAQVSSELQNLYDEQGIDVQTQSHKFEVVPLQDWQDSPISEGWRLLWETLPNGESAIIISLGEVLNVNRLIQDVTDQPNLYWIDRKSEISDLFSQYRYSMEWLLVIAMVSIMVLFMATKGLRQGFMMSIPIILSVLFPLGMMGILGISLNLFNILALILVIGMSIDYVLFFSSSQKSSRHVALLAIVMAAVISELTFGLLAMSGTNAISGFGLMLLLGILTALLLSPLAMDRKVL